MATGTWVVAVSWNEDDPNYRGLEVYGPFDTKDARKEWVDKAEGDPQFETANFWLTNIDPPDTIMFAVDDERPSATVHDLKRGGTDRPRQ